MQTSEALRKPEIGSPAFLVSAALALLTLCVFWQVHSFGFINLDDPSYVTGNPHVLQGMTWASVKWAFTGVHGANWHPLTSLSHLLDIQIFGLHAGAHHLVNLAFHVVNVLLLFELFRRMTGAMWCSAFVAVLFAIHPLRVESVVWISERKDVLSGFFWMLSLLAYWRYVRNRSSVNYVALLLLFALGLLSKPMVVTLPVVLLLLDFWPLHRLPFFASANFVSAGGEQLQRASGAQVLVEKLPMFILSLAGGIMTLNAQREAIVSVAGLPIQIRVFNSILSYVQYLKKTVWPVDLAIFYPFQRTFSLNEIVAGLFLLCAAVFVSFAVARTLPYVVTGLFWYLITLLPVIGLVQVGEQCYADRYTYLTSIGLYVVVAWGLKDIVSRHPFLRIPAVMLVVLATGTFSVLAFNYASLWRSDDLLLRHALQVTKNNSSAHCTLGLKLVQEGRYEEALAEFQESLKAPPDLAQAHIGMGVAFFGLGRPDEAEKCFRDAIKAAPHSGQTYIDLGIALDKQGRSEESLHEFEEGVRIAPEEPYTHSNLATAYFKRGNIGEAIAQYRAALRLFPNHLDSLRALAWILATDRDARWRNGPEAVKLAEEACKLTKSQDSGSLEALAAAQAETGDFEGASGTALKALDLMKTDTSAHDASLEERLKVALGLYQSGFPYRR